MRIYENFTSVAGASHWGSATRRCDGLEERGGSVPRLTDSAELAAMDGGLDGPIGTAASQNCGEIGPFERVLVFRKLEFPEREEVFAKVESFEAAMRTVHDHMRDVHAETSKILGCLGKVIEMKHGYSSRENLTAETRRQGEKHAEKSFDSREILQ